MGNCRKEFKKYKLKKTAASASIPGAPAPNLRHFSGRLSTHYAFFESETFIYTLDV